MARPASSRRPSPIFCPTKMVIPMVSPVTTMATVCISTLPVETPDTSAVWENCPTTSRSTPPYSDCKNSAAKTGMAKRIRDVSTLPSVRSLVFLIVSRSFAIKKAG